MVTKREKKKNMKSRILLVLSVIMILTGCVKEEADHASLLPVAAERTLLVYLAGDNNLWHYMDKNIAGIRNGMKAQSVSAATKVVVYYDTPYAAPRLTEITTAGETVLKEYPEQNSASGATLREVVGDMLLLSPARHYGLVLGSHGTGWVPASAIGELTRTHRDNSGAWPETRFFGEDVSANPTGYMDIDKLANALPDKLFEYILFDACHMGSVEVAYALRNKADYIISSPAEIIADGFPYESILPAMLAHNPDLTAACAGFYHYYAGHEDKRYHSATVSLVRTAGLPQLWQTVNELSREALENNPAVFDEMDLQSIQHYDRYSRHFMYDLKEVVERMAASSGIPAEKKRRFYNALDATVLYEAHTPYCFGKPVRVHCGLSTYVPRKESGMMNKYYSSNEWNLFLDM